jgi:hypothetical protein
MTRKGSYIDNDVLGRDMDYGKIFVRRKTELE